MADLSASEIEDVREVFDLFDFWDGRDGMVDGAKVADFLRCCGLNPTNTLVEKNGGTKKLGEKQYKFEEILPIYKVIEDEKDTGTFADFMEGFKTFDREGQGYISAAEMRNVLTMMGDKQYRFEEIVPIYEHVKREEAGTYKDFLEGFRSFDREGAGFIPAATLRNALTCLGARQYKFQQILPIYRGLKHADEGTFKEFKEAFKSYDREGLGFMSMMELRNVLTHMGERLTDNEVNEIIKSTETAEDLDGNIKYEEFIKKTMAGDKK